MEQIEKAGRSGIRNVGKSTKYPHHNKKEVHIEPLKTYRLTLFRFLFIINVAQAINTIKAPPPT